MVLLAALVAHSIAGTYFVGDGSGMNFTLTLRPDGTFTHAWHGCFDEETVAGRYRVQHDVVRLSAPTRSGPEDPPRALVIVRWSNRTYLVPLSRLSEFCVRYRMGWRGADNWSRGRFFCDVRYPKGGRPAAALLGVPQVPPSYAPFLRRPLTIVIIRNLPGFVTAVERASSEGRTEATYRGFVVGVGRADGVPLWAGLSAPGGRQARILRMTEHEAVCCWEWERPRRFVRRGRNLTVLSTDPPSRVAIGTRLNLVF